MEARKKLKVLNVSKEYIAFITLSTNLLKVSIFWTEVVQMEAHKQYHFTLSECSIRVSCAPMLVHGFGLHV